jgi:TolA-binding protein
MPHRISRGRPAASRGPAEEPKETTGWRQLALRGSYREALAEAEASGFPGLCAALPPGDLLMLADAARFAGRGDRARQALLALRERFASGPERAMATFALGRMAADDQRDHLAAAHWFEATLEEQSGGDLARESLGRLVESLERGGDHPAARRRAQSYLARFPGGPHAKLAYDVLQR